MSGFWPGLVVAPLLVGGIGMVVERYGLRRVHKHGHVAELLFTFGLTFVIQEVVRDGCGASCRSTTACRRRSTFPAFTVFSTNIRPSSCSSSLICDRHLRWRCCWSSSARASAWSSRPRSAIPSMVGMLGHDVDRIFMLVFGVGAGLAAVAGVIAGPALVTQSNMAGLLGPILFVVVVVGGLGSLGGAFVASLLIGLLQTFAVASNASLAGPLRQFGRSPRSVRPTSATSGPSRWPRSRRSCPTCCWC